MSKKKTEADKSMDKFFNEFIEKQKAAGASPAELAVQGEDLIKQLMKRFYESALQGEMDEHLGYAKSRRRDVEHDNLRNGTSNKNIITEHGSLEITTPRDRAGEFEPQIIPKNQRRLPGFNEKVLYLYGQGTSQRDIQQQLQEIYQIEVSQELISAVTDAVLEDVKAWRSRPLDRVYPIVYLDALVTKVHGDGGVTNRAVYVALGVNLEGQKEVLGLWLGENEGSKFWLRVLTEMKNRGLEDIFIACVDGLSGFSEAITTVYPQTRVQSCIVHAVRNSLKFVNWKERKQVAADLKRIYRSTTLESAQQELQEFRKKWDSKHPVIGEQWERNWDKLSVLFAYPDDIRRAIYTTNAIESLNHSLRKVLKNKKAFPSEDALMKVLYLSIERASKKWTMPIHNWGPALARFAIEFGARMPDLSRINL